MAGLPHRAHGERALGHVGEDGGEPVELRGELGEHVRRALPPVLPGLVGPRARPQHRRGVGVRGRADAGDVAPVDALELDVAADKLDQPQKMEALIQRAQIALAGVPESKETKELNGKIQAALKKLKK